MRIEKIHQGEPAIRLYMSDGSERSTYMAQADAVARLGAPHTGVNLMSNYYPKQSFWPERRIFGQDVPHFRHSICDETEKTRLEELNDWTDGYYSLVPEAPECEVLRQIADVRRHGQDARLTLEMETETSDEELVRIAERLKPFGRMEVRLNHEANGCTWFRFARNVGNLPRERQTPIYREISDFFLHARDVMCGVAPGLTFVACYNGPGGSAKRPGLGPDELPNLGPDELGPMYADPNVVASLDQYGSLGWAYAEGPEPPLIVYEDFADLPFFALTVHELCQVVFRAFHERISAMRGEPTRIDLGELDYAEAIHGPEVRAQLIYEAYCWVRRHPEVIGSVTFYELTDIKDLGLYRQREYGNLEDLTSNIVLDTYRRIMRWEEFRHPRQTAGEVGEGAGRVELLWRSSCDAEGLRVGLPAGAKALDCGEEYWRRVVFVGSDGAESYAHTDERRVAVPQGAVAALLFALPPDGRNNSPGGYRASVPLPSPAGPGATPLP